MTMEDCCGGWQVFVVLLIVGFALFWVLSGLVRDGYDGREKW
jgi:hypothetical protein